MKRAAAIIVAAGSSSRLGQPKQLIRIEGEPLLQRAIRIAQEAGASPVLVVLGAHRELIGSQVDFSDAKIVVNDEWQEGLASSIRAGVRALEREAPDALGILLMICDQSRVTAEHLRNMIDVFRTQPGINSIASTYIGTRGIPAIFPISAIPDLCALRGDKGARGLLAAPPWPVIEIPLEGGELDIDRPEDLERLG
jgi:molybdenum cofactor cytidylyltransferase